MLLYKPFTLIVLLFFGIAAGVYAQKLPAVQQTSLRAPAKVSIDGNDSEWTDGYQAYNHATDIFYTIANDDENIYLILQTNDADVLHKVFSSGISWSVGISDDAKSYKNMANITYPVLAHTPYLHLTKKKNESRDTSAQEDEAWMSRNNRILNDSCKFIRAYGISGLDTLISVYNRDGVKAKGLFNNKKAYVCEFSIKLKLLTASIKDAGKLKYRIQINGMKPIASIVMPPNPTPEMVERIQKATQYLNKELAPTFFEGEYTLIK